MSVDPRTGHEAAVPPAAAVAGCRPSVPGVRRRLMMGRQRVDGHDVRLTAPELRAGEPGLLRFRISREGRPVRIGLAEAYLIAAREDGERVAEVSPQQVVGDELLFELRLETACCHRLFLQFVFEGRGHTAAFVQEVTP